MIKGTAQLRLELQFNGTEKELIELCDNLAKDGTEFGLDSLDLGDAMGFIIEETMINAGDWNATSPDGKLILTASIDDGTPYNWEFNA